MEYGIKVAKRGLKMTKNSRGKKQPKRPKWPKMTQKMAKNRQLHVVIAHTPQGHGRDTKWRHTRCTGGWGGSTRVTIRALRLEGCAAGTQRSRLGPGQRCGLLADKQFKQFAVPPSSFQIRSVHEKLCRLHHPRRPNNEMRSTTLKRGGLPLSRSRDVIT